MALGAVHDVPDTRVVAAHKREPMSPRTTTPELRPMRIIRGLTQPFRAVELDERLLHGERRARGARARASPSSSGRGSNTAMMASPMNLSMSPPSDLIT